MKPEQLLNAAPAGDEPNANISMGLRRTIMGQHCNRLRDTSYNLRVVPFFFLRSAKLCLV